MLAIGFLSACTDALPPAPIVERFEPRRATAGTAIEIFGSFAPARATTIDYAKRDRPPETVEAEVHLVSTAPDLEVPLVSLTFIEPGHLRGSVPPGTPGGRYSLVLVDAFGRRAEAVEPFLVAVPELKLEVASTTLMAGLCSDEIRVSLEDAVSPAAVSIEAQGVPSSVFRPSNGQGCGARLSDAIVLDPLPAGSQAVFHLRPFAAGTLQVTASADGVKPASLALDVGPAAEDLSLSFSSLAQSFRVGTCQQIVVQRDRNGVPVPVATRLPLALTLSVGAEDPLTVPVPPAPAAYSDEQCGRTATTQLLMGSGESEASFWLRGERSGRFRVRVSEASHVPASATIELEAGEATGLRLAPGNGTTTSSGPICLGVSQCLDLRLSWVDMWGNEVESGATGSVRLSVNEGPVGTVVELREGSGCTGSIAPTEVTLGSPMTLSLSSSDTAAAIVSAEGSIGNDIVRTDLRLIAGTPQIALVPTGDAVAGDSAWVDVQVLRSPTGPPLQLPWSAPITLASAPTANSADPQGLKLCLDSACTQQTTEVTITPSASDGQFIFSSERSGPVYLSASFACSVPGGSYVNIRPEAFEKLAIVTPPRTIRPSFCDPSKPIVVQAQDRYGNPVIAEDAGIAFQVTPDLSPFTTCDDVQPSHVLQAGQSSVALYPDPAQSTSAIVEMSRSPNPTPDDTQALTVEDLCGNGSIDPGEDCDFSAPQFAPPSDIQISAANMREACSGTCAANSGYECQGLLGFCQATSHLAEVLASGGCVVGASPPTYCSLEEALDAAETASWSTILVPGGNYGRAEIDPDRGGLLIIGPPLNALSQGSTVAASFTSLDLDGDGHSISVMNIEVRADASPAIRIQNGTTALLKNVVVTGGSGVGIQVDAGAVAYLDSVTIDGHSGVAIEGALGSRVVLIRSRVTSNRGGGLRLFGAYDVTNSVIAYNGSQVSTLGGVYLGSSATIRLFAHNTVVGNRASSSGWGGVQCGGQSQRIWNSIVWGNARDLGPVGGESPSDIHRGGCESRRNNVYPGPDTVATEIATDPRLLDVWDLHLACSSPNIDAGDPDAGVTIDIDGETRGPYSSGHPLPDLGADEALCLPAP